MNDAANKRVARQETLYIRATGNIVSVAIVRVISLYTALIICIRCRRKNRERELELKLESLLVAQQVLWPIRMPFQLLFTFVLGDHCGETFENCRCHFMAAITLLESLLESSKTPPDPAPARKWLQQVKSGAWRPNKASLCHTNTTESLLTDALKYPLKAGCYDKSERERNVAAT